MSSSQCFAIGCGLLALLFAAGVVGSAEAQQQYKVDPVDPKAKDYATAAVQSIRNPARFSQDREQFEAYFTRFYFPEMTQTSPEALGRLGDMRYNLFKKFLWASDNEQLQQRLTELAFGAMGKIVTADPPYHPAVRYNAILIIGMLDDEYARDGANSRPAKPMARANRALTVIVDSATTSNRYPPPVILGSIIGMERHAQLRQSLAPDAVQAMTAALLKLVNHDKPIQEINRTAYAWLQLRAASVLAELGSAGTNNTVHDALVHLAGNLRSLDDRCAVAGLLKKIDYKDVKLDAAAVEPLFQLARDLGEAEAKRAQEYQDKQIGGGIGFSPGRSEGGYMADMYGGQEQFPRHHVLARLVDLRDGLTAVKPSAPAETQTQIDAVIAAIKPVTAAAIDKNIVELAFIGEINKMARAINLAVPSTEPAAAAEETF